MLRLSTGNKKLKNNDKVRFLIWNLPSQITCPYSTDLCRKYYYAKKAERLYKGALASRMDNYNESLKADFEWDMCATIAREVMRKPYQGKQILFRIHESGDFYSKEYAEKWLNIARSFPNIKFLAYTKSIPFFDGLTLPDNFTLRASIWADTDSGQIEAIVANNYPTYTAVPKDEYATLAPSMRCDCAIGCGDCKKCWNKNIKSLITAIH